MQALKWHPDKNEEENRTICNKYFQQIVFAYNTLTNKINEEWSGDWIEEPTINNIPSDEYEVREVIDMVEINNIRYYLLKWTGYMKPDWVSADDTNCEKLIKKYSESIGESGSSEYESNQVNIARIRRVLSKFDENVIYKDELPLLINISNLNLSYDHLILIKKCNHVFVGLFYAHEQTLFISDGGNLFLNKKEVQEIIEKRLPDNVGVIGIKNQLMYEDNLTSEAAIILILLEFKRWYTAKKVLTIGPADCIRELIHYFS